MTVPVCTKPDCGFQFWQNAKPTSCALIPDSEGRLLFGTRAREPFAGMLDLPGGFLKLGEHPEDGLHREIAEELGVEVQIERLLGVIMDSYGAPDVHTLNFAYLCKITQGQPRAADDVASLEWLDPTTVDRTRLSFEGNAKMVDLFLLDRGQPKS